MFAGRRPGRRDRGSVNKRAHEQHWRGAPFGGEKIVSMTRPHLEHSREGENSEGRRSRSGQTDVELLWLADCSLRERENQEVEPSSRRRSFQRVETGAWTAGESQGQRLLLSEPPTDRS